MGETSMVTTLLTSVQTGVMAELGNALPIAGVVFAALAGIGIGLKIFKRVTGARG